MSRLSVILTILLCVIFARFSVAAEIGARNYDIYIGDINGDGYSDFYFLGKPLILILHGDITTPITIFPGNYAVFRNDISYSAPQVHNIDVAAIAQKTNAGTFRLAALNVDYFLWRNGTNTQTNVLLRGADASEPSLLLIDVPALPLPILAQTYQPHADANMGNKNQSISISDINGDAKSDIVVGAYVYLADAAEIPSLNPVLTNQSGPITTTFIYDDLSRLIQAQATDGSNTNYHYDSQDNRTSTYTTKGVNP